MSINGVDITKQFMLICGTSWLILYVSLFSFVVIFKPKTKPQRRWKASLLIGGLPVLGIPLLLGIVSALLNLKGNNEIGIAPTELLIDSLTSIMAITVCTIPISGLMAIFAIFGAHSQMKFADYLLDKIVPPSEDEKPNVHDWL